MLYNLAFNQAKSIELGLNLSETLVLSAVVSTIASPAIVSIELDGTRYFWLSKSLINHQLPIMEITDDRISRVRKSLVEKGFLHPHPHPKNIEYFAITPLVGQWLGDTSTEKFTPKVSRGGVGKNTEPLGKNTDGGSVKIPTIKNIDSISTLTCTTPARESSKKGKGNDSLQPAQWERADGTPTDVWERVVLPALNRRNELLEEQNTKKGKSDYCITPRIVATYCKMAAETAQRIGIEPLVDYIAANGHKTWIALLGYEPYILERINHFKRQPLNQAANQTPPKIDKTGSILQDIPNFDQTHTDAYFMQMSSKWRQCVGRGEIIKPTPLSHDELEKQYQQLNSSIKKYLPKCQLLTRANFLDLLFGDTLAKHRNMISGTGAMIAHIAKVVQKKGNEKDANFFTQPVHNLICDSLSNN